MGAIEEKIIREMVEDRDLALAAKELEIAGLNEQIASLELELRNAWKHPLSDDEKATKKILSDYEATVEMTINRAGIETLGSSSLLDVVRYAFNALDITRKERDRYASAWAIVHNASNKASKVAEGKS